MSPGISIAIFSGYYASHGGGIEIVCEKVAAGLAERGYRVLWCALEDKCPSVGLVGRCPLPGTDIAYRLTGTPMPLPAPLAIRRIWRTVKDANVVLIAEANFLTNAIAFLAAKLQGRPILLVQHLGLPSTASRIARCLTYLGELFVARPMIRSAETTAFVSPVVRNYFKSVATKNHDLVIGHGTDISLFRCSRSGGERDSDRQVFGLGREERVACFVGRCTVSKGVEIIAEMARKRPDWTFVIAGSGPIDPANWNLPNVKVLGQIEQSQLATLYRAIDVLLLPSPSESFSLVVREALASGTRVLCGDSVLLTDTNLEHYVSALPVDLARIESTSSRFVDELDKPHHASTDAAAYVRRQCSWDAAVVKYAGAIEALAAHYSKSKLATA